MKKLIVPFVVAALLASCGGGGGSDSGPGSVAIEFNKALGTGDIAKAKEYCTKESAQVLDMIGGMMAMMPDSAKEANANVKMTVLRDSIVEDRAWVWLQSEGSEESEATELQKVDGEWKVVFSKE